MVVDVVDVEVVAMVEVVAIDAGTEISGGSEPRSAVGASLPHAANTIKTAMEIERTRVREVTWSARSAMRAQKVPL